MTEEISRKFIGLDQWGSDKIVSAIYDGQLEALRSIAPALSDIAQAADDAANRLGQSGRLIYVGAGTSGRLAVQDGSELAPTYNWPQERIAYAMAGGMEALLKSQEGAEDIEADGKAAMDGLSAGQNDVVICVAASGQTPFTLGALRRAKARGALTIGVANNAGTALLTEADHGLLAQTGGEIVAGSTRMKAGTAQKIMLNMISTTIMIRLGRVYDGYMVDMVISNDKLQRRGENMVADIAGCKVEQARSALALCGNNIKAAILICRGASPEQALECLNQSGGNLRKAMALYE